MHSEQESLSNTRLTVDSGLCICLLLPAKLFLLPHSSSKQSCRGHSGLMPLCRLFLFLSLLVSSHCSLFFLCRAATMQDTLSWSTRWSTTFTSSPAASSTPRSLPSLVRNAHGCKHAETHTHTFILGSKASFLAISLIK